MLKPLPIQTSTVLKHLRSYPHITSMQADGVYHIRRLASRIDELRARGYEIETQTAEDAKGQRYTRYSLSRRQKRAKHPVLPPRTAAQQFKLETLKSAYAAYCKQELGVPDNGYDIEAEVEAFITFITEFSK